VESAHALIPHSDELAGGLHKIIGLVARGVDDPALSEEILREVRATLRSGSVDRVA
jgi:hypothetical protein